MIRFLTSILIVAVSAGLAVAAPFVHPGGLHTKEDFQRMRTKVAAKEHPWIDGWGGLLKDRKAQADYKAAPHRHMVSRQRAQDDATAAYLNALRWQISGERENAECAVRILNAWADGVKEVPRGNDQPGLSGIPIGSFALAAEVLRDYPGWSGGDQKKFKDLLLNYFYPVCRDFLTRHNGASDSNYWANWDTCNMQAVMAIGVFCDDRAKFDEAVEYFKKGRGMGAIKNAVPFLYQDGLGQWQESGRDQAHVMGGMGLLVQMCQMAWNQGVDLYGYDDNRLLAGAEYTAQYTLWKGVPYSYYTNSSKANQHWVSENYHGRLAAAHFELVYNHYVVRKGLKAPHVKLFAELKRPEPGDVDVFGHGTLTFTLDAKASPFPAGTVPPVPQDLVATAGMGRVDLKWSPSGAYSARGYEVFRGESQDGPFTSIYSTDNWTTPMYADLKVEPGKKYHYKVAALNQYGVSERSAAVSTVVATPAGLPEGWMDGKAGGARSALEGTSFSLKSQGRGMGGNSDDCEFVARTFEGDFVLTGRLIERTGKAGVAGLMARAGEKNDSSAIMMTLGEAGGRQARLRVREKDGDKTATSHGNDYTWLPAWFRIARKGGDFTGYQSSDGIVWFEIGKGRIGARKECLIGLMATGDEGEVRFDNVSVVEELPQVPAAPKGLTVAAVDGAAVLKWSAGDALRGIKVEAATGEGQFYEIADLEGSAVVFANTGLKNVKGIRYRVRAYNVGGYSEYSDVAGAK